MVAEVPRARRDDDRHAAMAWGFNPYLIRGQPVQGRLPRRRRKPSRKLVAAGFRRKAAYLHLPGILRAPARRARALGQARGRSLLGALMAQMRPRGCLDRRQGLHVRQLRGPRRPADARELCHRLRQDRPHDVTRVQGRRSSRSCCIAPQLPHATDCSPEADEHAQDARRRREAHRRRVTRSPWQRAGYGCSAEELFKMCLGNGIGVELDKARGCRPPLRARLRQLHRRAGRGRGAPRRPRRSTSSELGHTIDAYELRVAGETIDLAETAGGLGARARGRLPLPQREHAASSPSTDEPRHPADLQRHHREAARRDSRVPGQQLRVRHRRSPSSAPAPTPHTFVVNNLTPAKVAESTAKLVEAIDASQIVHDHRRLLRR